MKISLLLASRCARHIGLFVAGLLLLPGFLQAQQVPILSHYYLNPYLINPASVGRAEDARAYLAYRHQWVGIAGAPETQAFTLDGPLRDRRIGIGLSVNNDVSHIVSRLTGMLSSSYTLPLATGHDLSFGMSWGIVRNDLKFDKIRGDITDPGLLRNMESRTAFDGSVGLLYRASRLQIGAVSEQLLNRRLTYQHGTDFREMSFRLVRHYLVSFQYDIPLQGDFTLTPLVVLRNAQGLPLAADVNAGVKYKDHAWINAVYRYKSGSGISLGGQINEKFIISYYYEIPVHALRQATTGSHEVMIGMRLKHQRSGSSVTKNETNLRVMEEVKRDSKAQFEKLDEIQQNNEALNRQLLEYKKMIEQQQDEISQLKKTLAGFEQDAKVMIDQWKVDLQKENVFDTQSRYYLVIGAVRTFSEAKTFQRLIRRETRLKPEIIQNENQTWYFIYSDELKSAGEARKKIQEIEESNVRQFIVGNPWVYKISKP